MVLKAIYTLRYTEMTPEQNAAAMIAMTEVLVNYEYDPNDSSWVILILPTDEQIAAIDAAIAAVA